MKTSLIGLDIGSVSIKAAQWQRAAGIGSRWHLRSAVWPRLATGQLSHDEADRITQVLARRGFHGSNAALLAPSDLAHVEELDLPAAAIGASRVAVARMELSRVCRIDQGGFEFETWDLPRAGRPGEVAVGAAVLAHADADRFVLPLQSAGLSVLRIGSSAAALGRLIGSAGSTVDAVADIGTSALSLSVLVGGVCVYERQLAELGTHAIIESLTKVLNISHAKAAQTLEAAARNPGGPVASAIVPALRQLGTRIGEEISVSLEYASHRYPKAVEGRMLAVGGGACHPAILKAAEASLGCDVQTPGNGFLTLDPELAPPWCLVAAVAMLVAPSPLSIGGPS